MSANDFEIKDSSKTTTEKIAHFTSLSIRDFYEVAKAYITDKLEKIFSTLEPTEPKHTQLKNCVVATLKNYYIKVGGNGKIDSMNSNAICKLIALLQSVRLIKVSGDSSTKYGVNLYFDDDLEPNDEGVNSFKFMMGTILGALRDDAGIINSFKIYRNGNEIFPKLTTPLNTHPIDTHLQVTSARTSISDRTSISTSDNIRKEVTRIVDIIFQVSEVSEVSDQQFIATRKLQTIHTITDSFIQANISNAILDFLKEVEDSDIMLDDTSTTITLTLHDKIKLTQRGDKTYCQELLKFLGLMGVLCSICTTELYAIGLHKSVTFNIPKRFTNSLHKSVESCTGATEAVAAAAAVAAAPVAAAAAAAAAKAKAEAAATTPAATATRSTAEGGDGRRPLRKHARKTNRKHARKTHHKPARKTRHKRTRRSRAARKHKKYSRRH
jgi:hypothetical protein